MEDEWNWMKWRLREIKECHYHYLEGMMYQSLSFGHYLASSVSSLGSETYCGGDVLMRQKSLNCSFFLVDFPSHNSLFLRLTCFWSSEKTGSRTLLAITRSMGLRSQPSSCALMGSLWVEVVAGVVVVVVVVLLGWNSSSIKAWKHTFNQNRHCDIYLSTLMLTWLWSAVGWTSLALSWSLPSTAMPKFWIRSSRSSLSTCSPWAWWWPWSWSWPPELQRTPANKTA